MKKPLWRCKFFLRWTVVDSILLLIVFVIVLLIMEIVGK
jgi:hypothetical protein